MPLGKESILSSTLSAEEAGRARTEYVEEGMELGTSQGMN